MSSELKQLIEAARSHELTAVEKEDQRRSFAYGNTRIENPRITREIVAEQAEQISRATKSAR